MKLNSQTHVIVGMSGGVDSSVSALLLKQQGYKVEGLFMKNWDEDDGTDACTAMQDLADAQTVCDTLGIKLHTASFAAEYWDRVFEHFLSEYRAGRTPNPDILCNKEIKFKAFLDYATLLGADYIATGHYVRTKTVEDKTWLIKGVDQNKDQTYFLYAVTQDKLARTLFPVGGLPKAQVRALAQTHGLITHDKKDSTGICFIGERKFRDFLKNYLPAQPGAIETPEGHRIGRHQGLMYHTIGQREGLGIGGLKDFDDKPWYVVKKDLARNVLVVAQGNQHPWLYAQRLQARHIDWIDPEGPMTTFTCKAKTRYRQPEQTCTVNYENACMSVRFGEPQRAVTPGQSIVFYDGDRCLGGAIIESAD